MTKGKVSVLIALLVVIVGSIWYLESQKSKPGTSLQNEVTVSIPSMTPAEKEGKYEKAKEIINPSGFVNTEGITIQELIGKKVILVDFWTYSCINCQRTLPYITAWYEKYRDQGLEIIGVHTPEFEFEKKLANVQWAADNYSIEYPIVLDNDYATWRNYGNRYWPRKYLIDIDGFIVYDHIGEGSYEETEKKIQELLEERRGRLNESGEITKDITQPENAETVNNLMPRSPETYFGALRNEFLGNGEAYSAGKDDFSRPGNIETNILYLEGEWGIEDEFAQSLSSGSRIIYRYQGKKVFFVASAEAPTRITVLLDGNSVSESKGADVGAYGDITIQTERLYRLIEDVEYGEHTLEIISEDPGLRAYTFTFG